MKVDKFSEKDILKSINSELHLDLESLEGLIFQLILLSNELKFQKLQGNDNVDAVLEVSILKKPIASVTNPFKKVYVGVALRVLGMGYFINEDNTMGVHEQDAWGEHP